MFQTITSALMAHENKLTKKYNISSLDIITIIVILIDFQLVLPTCTTRFSIFIYYEADMEVNGCEKVSKSTFYRILDEKKHICISKVRKKVVNVVKV